MAERNTLYYYLGVFNLGAVALAAIFISLNLHGFELFQLGNIPYLVLFLFQLLSGIWVLFTRWSAAISITLRQARMLTEGMLSLALLLFFFAYFYAENANLDYAQRFAETNGNMELAVDSFQERMQVLIQYGPHLIALLTGFVMLTVRTRQLNFVQRYALPLVLLGASLRALAMPSGIFEEGVGLFAWVALVPLFLVIRITRYRQALFFTLVYGSFTVIFSHYWLGTFSFVSLQFSVLMRILYYTVFFIPGIYVIKRFSGILVPVLIWTIFEWYLHQGFAAFPWGVLPHTQYKNSIIIQIASVTGIWGISFLIALANATISDLLVIYLARLPQKLLFRVLPIIVLMLATLGFGLYTMLTEPAETLTARVALIQNNSDPRKHSYERTLSILRILSDQTDQYSPDLIIWPETAIVPNIKRWGAMDRDTNNFTRVVHEFLEYQKNKGVWLLTGNDDYSLTTDPETNKEIRKDYNAAILFSDTGERVDTYHKQKLVPFTEYFPYVEQLPWVHDILMSFDVHLWEPGTDNVVFNYPKFKFSTLICFEDSFPTIPREMVQDGAEVLVNLSNDYWAQDPVEAQQHYATAVFRTIEHRRPLLRATTSGLTSYIDSYGRLQGSTKMYEPNFLIADISLPKTKQTTIYTRFGDWFVWLNILALVGVIGRYLYRRRKR